MIELSGIIDVLRSMIKALPVTGALSLLTLALAFIIAIFLALLEYLQVKGFQTFIKVFTSFFRGTPLVAQLFFIYFGLPSLFPAAVKMTGFTAAVITMSLNNAAYIKEAIRGALMSVEKGQLEAGYSLGYSRKQVIRHIVLPQAALIALPSLSNSFVDIIKGSSMAFVVGVIEMTAAAQLYSASTLKFFEGYFSLIIMYWGIVLLLEQVLKRAELALSERIL